MGITTIGIKQLHKELKHITEDVQGGDSFLVIKNAKPVFRIEPVDKQENYSLADITKARFYGDRNVSKKIDAIVYGKK